MPRTDFLHIVSLLGRKRDCFSEFGYYPFRSSHEPGIKPPFEQWLNEQYGPRFAVYEFPTVDAQGIEQGILEAAVTVLKLLEAGHTVIVVDSAGAERTARVCEAVGYNEL